MKKPSLPYNAPESWKLSFAYDEMEVFGSLTNKGYSNAYQNRFNSIINLIKKYLAKNSSILDLAAGSGNITLTLAEAGYRMYWNDLREDLLPYVQMKYTSGIIDYVPGNIFELHQSSVDGIIISEIIEHVAHPDEFLMKVSGLVKPGGYVFLSTPLGSYFLNKLPMFSDFEDTTQFEERQFKPNADGHIFLLHLDELKALGERAGLKIMETTLNNNPLSSGHIKLHYLLRVFPAVFIGLMERCTNALPKNLSVRLHANVVIVYQKKL